MRGNERRSRARSEQGRRFRARRPDTKPRAESRSCEFSLFLFLKARAERAPCTSSRQIRAKRGGTLFFRLGGELQRIALAPAGLGPAGGLGLGDVSGVDGRRIPRADGRSSSRG